MDNLKWITETTDHGKSGLLVRSPQIGLAWMMADEAAEALHKKLQNQHPKTIIRDNQKHYFFPYED